MNIPIVLSQVLGIIFAVMGLSVLINKKSVVALIEESAANQGFLWLSGLIALIIGAVLVGINNSWTSGLKLFLTVIGWLAVIKGLFILLFPKTAISLYRKLNNSGVLTTGGLIAFILGLVLLYKGFM